MSRSKVVARVETDEDGTVRLIVEAFPLLNQISLNEAVPRRFALPVASYSTLGDPSNDKAWSLLYKGIVDNIGASPDSFQLVYPFISWNWPTQNRGYTGAAQFDFCSNIPQWSATGQSAFSGRTLHDAYFGFLQAIVANVSDPATENQIVQQRNKLTGAYNQYDTDLAQANLAYKSSGSSLSFTEWLGSLEGQRWQGLLNTDLAQISQITDVLNSLLAKSKTPGLSDAMAASKNTDYYTKLVDNGLSSFPSVPAYSISQDPTSWLSNVQGGGGTPGKFSFSLSDASYSYQNTWAKGSVSVGSWFWQVYVNGSWQQISEFSSSTDITVSVAFKAVDQIQITAAPWYNGAFPRNHKTGPFTNGFTPDSFWGEKGSFNLIKTGFFVAYQPNISIEVDQQTFNSFKSKWEVCGGIRVGPFSFGGGGGSSTDTFNKSTSGLSFIVQSTSTTPVIFGNTINILP
jgi:hypothetical protein